MGQIQNQRIIVTSHLCNHCHKMCWRGLVVQSLAWFDSNDPTVPIDGELGKWGGLIRWKATESAWIRITADTHFSFT